MKALLVLVAACSTSHDAPAPEPTAAKPAAVAPDADIPARCAASTGMAVDHFQTVSAALPAGPGKDPPKEPDQPQTIAIDTAACKYARVVVGSAWVLVHPVDDKRCELWMGGDTPSNYCLFERGGTFKIPYTNAAGLAKVRCCP